MTSAFEDALLDAYKDREIRKYSVVRDFVGAGVQHTYTLYVAHVSPDHRVTTPEAVDDEDSLGYSIPRVLDLVARYDPDWVLKGSEVCYPFGKVKEAASMRLGKKMAEFQSLCIPSERLGMFCVHACTRLLRKFDVAAIAPDKNGNIIEIPHDHRFPEAVMDKISPNKTEKKNGTLYSFAMFKRTLDNPAS